MKGKESKKVANILKRKLGKGCFGMKCEGENSQRKIRRQTKDGKGKEKVRKKKHW